MSLFKILRATIIAVIILLIVFVLLFFGPDFFILQFNRITIDEAINLAENYQIKEVGEAYRGPAGRIIILTNDSRKLLDNKYVSARIGNNLYPSKNYQKFMEILNNSETRCGFKVRIIYG